VKEFNVSSLKLTTELVMSLSSLHSKLIKKIDQRLSAHGISFTEFMVLSRLDAAPDKTLRRIDLAESVGLSASGVTRLLSPMEKIKLVQKEVNPRDARVSLVKLSRTGERVFKEALVSFEESAGSFMEALNDKQLAKLLELTKTLL
jgi:DNA-binding MarR family transcriptional regulator